MIAVRKSAERGPTRLGWLDSRHSFSFGEYHDPRYMGFRSLRVINEDRVSPGGGFPTHGHQDMEIVSYVLEGELQHRDSIGTGSVIRPGEVQRMSAGSGIRHSEFNASQDHPVHFLQIWILPRVKSLPPSYEQRSFASADSKSGLGLIASPDGRDGSLTLHQDASIHVGRLGAGENIEFSQATGRHTWLQITRGAIEVLGENLREGDGAAISEEPHLAIRSTGGKTEFLLFNLA